ncbi:MAG: ChbG/HpnK family deacetylase [Chlorobi bacterium]|nr:ChbG/HpnK family deacetylase [Chlorobiota bacterium]
MHGINKLIPSEYFILFSVFFFFNLVSVSSQQKDNPESEIYLIVRGDDMGFCHATNVACIRSFRKGIIRSVEVMVPAPWFLDAAEMLKENPGLDVGVHLTLTSEWKNYKWRPVTGAPGLQDADGYFFPTVQALQQAIPDPDIVEKELRAQIKMAMKHIPNLTHLSDHMGASSCRPEYKEIVNKLSREYNLPVILENAHEEIGFWDTPADKKEAFLYKTINNLMPGLWIIYCHPGLDTPETQGIISASQHPSDVFMAEYRAAVTKAVTSDRIKTLINQKGIHLVSYGTMIK